MVTVAQVMILLQEIKSKMKCKEDKEVIEEYIKRMWGPAWAEIVRELLS